VNIPSRSPAEALAQAVAIYGERGAESAAKINSDNRSFVKFWLTACGVPSADVSTFKLAALKELWSDTTDETLGEWVKSPSGASDDKAKRAADAIRDLIGAAHMDEARVIELINQHATKTVRNEIALPNGRVITLPAEAYHPVFPEVLAAIASGLNVLLVGPAGSGKTHLCEQVAKAIGADFSFTGAIMQEHKALGFINAKGEVVRTAFRDRYELGGLFLADEIDASSAQALLTLNAGLANSSQDFPDANIKRHSDFRAIASANTFGTGANAQYVGRNQLDAASLDRFFVIQMDYDEATERAIYLGEAPSPVSLFSPRRLTQAEKAAWVDYCHAARRGVAALAVRHVVSSRAIAAGLKALEAGIPRATVERGALWKNLDAATIAKIKAAA
jgi:cobaltochelatase CobS